jgi:hypothetical protein
VLFAIYAVLGVLLGMLAGVPVAIFGFEATRPAIRALGSGTLGLAFAASLASQPSLQRSEQIGVAVGCILAAVAVVVNVSTLWRDRLAFLTGPFTASLLLLASPWTNRVIFTSNALWIPAIHLGKTGRDRRDPPRDCLEFRGSLRPVSHLRRDCSPPSDLQARLDC